MATTTSLKFSRTIGNVSVESGKLSFRFDPVPDYVRGMAPTTAGKRDHVNANIEEEEEPQSKRLRIEVTAAVEEETPMPIMTWSMRMEASKDVDDDMFDGSFVDRSGTASLLDQQQKFVTRRETTTTLQHPTPPSKPRCCCHSSKKRKSLSTRISRSNFAASCAKGR
jgi:hypothetical protein